MCDARNRSLRRASARDDQCAEAEDTTQDTLIDLNAFDLVQVYLDCLTADEPVLDDDSLCRDRQLRRLVAHIGHCEEHQSKSYSWDEYNPEGNKVRSSDTLFIRYGRETYATNN